MVCCNGRVKENQMMILSGTNLSQTTGQMARQNPGMGVFTPDMEYLPGDSVPLSSIAPGSEERLRAVVGRAMEMATKGVPVVLGSDAWGNHAQTASHGMSQGKIEIPTSAVLLHKPLATVVSESATTEQLMRNLIDFGVLYKGVTQRPAQGSLGFVTPHNVNAACAAAKRLPSTSGIISAADAEMMSEISRKHLLNSLSLTTNPAGVHLVPRAEYDHIVKAHRSGAARTAALLSKLNPVTNSVLKNELMGSGFILNVRYPHFCTSCMASHAANNPHELACGRCVSHMSELTNKVEMPEEKDL